MKRLPGILKFCIYVYGIQLALVFYWRIFPIDNRNYGGKTYCIEHGFNGTGDFYPLAGFLAINGEPVRFFITDNYTGQVDQTNYDLATDVYQRYPDVFPDKQAEVPK